MSKAILVIDKMPKNCQDCQLSYYDDEYEWYTCFGKNGVADIEKEYESGTIPSWCPLKEIDEIVDMPTVDAIPVEWIEEWGWKNGMSESMSLRVMIDDWRKENER